MRHIAILDVQPTTLGGLRALLAYYFESIRQGHDYWPKALVDDDRSQPFTI